MTQPTPSPLTREQIESLELSVQAGDARAIHMLAQDVLVLTASHEALRLTVEQQVYRITEMEDQWRKTNAQYEAAAKVVTRQAQELERVMEELGDLKLRLNCPMLAPSCLVCGQGKPFVIKHLEASAIGVCEDCRSAAQQLAAMTRERDEAIERELRAKRQLALSETRHDEIRQLCDREGVHHPEAAITKAKQQLTTAQARVMELERVKVERDLLQQENMNRRTTLGDLVHEMQALKRQLAAAQARVRELEATK